jgi:uncharacterized protein (TIGR02594 family)
MKFQLQALIAQHLLKSGGFYDGALDGLWGPKSIQAADEWASDRDAALDKPSTIVPGAPTPYELALRHIGQKEIPGSKDNPLIVTWLRKLGSWINHDETPWCAAFVNAMAREAGFEQTGKLNARSFLEVGQPVRLTEAKRGDVVIFWRNSPDSWEGHVGFLESYDATTGKLRILGGNQSDSVSIATFTTHQLLGVRRLRSLDSLQGNSGNRTV